MDERRLGESYLREGLSAHLFGDTLRLVRSGGGKWGLSLIFVTLAIRFFAGGSLRHSGRWLRREVKQLAYAIFPSARARLGPFASSSLSTLPTRGGWAEGSHGARSALPQREDPMGYGPDRTPSKSNVSLHRVPPTCPGWA